MCYHSSCMYMYIILYKFVLPFVFCSSLAAGIWALPIYYRRSTFLPLYCVSLARSCSLYSLVRSLYIDFIKISIRTFTRLLFFIYRCQFMYGELTDKETITRLDYTLENQLQDQFEVLLYKSNSKYQLFIYYHEQLIVTIILSQMTHSSSTSWYYCTFDMCRRLEFWIPSGSCVYRRKYQFMFGFHGNISLSFNLPWHFIDIFGHYCDCCFCFSAATSKPQTCSFMFLIMLYIDRLSICLLLSLCLRVHCISNVTALCEQEKLWAFGR